MVRELRAQVRFLRDQVQGVSTTPGQIRSSGRTYEKLQEFPGATIWSVLLKKLRKNLLILAAEFSTHHWKAYWTVFNNWYAFTLSILSIDPGNFFQITQAFADNITRRWFSNLVWSQEVSQITKRHQQDREKHQWPPILSSKNLYYRT